jgi:hypothetical protein
MKKLFFCTTALLLLLLLANPVYAYLDPGTGSMILQLFLGGLAGLVVILKLYWRRILGMFRITKDEEK